MPSNILNRVVLLALWAPASARLVGITNHSTATSGCPAACNGGAGDCRPGTSGNGGLTLVSGTCFGFCSSPYQGARYCGDGADYVKGGVDCRACKGPEHYAGRIQLHTPQGEVKGSVILLGPWGGALGWEEQWFGLDSANLDPVVKKHYRILGVVGKKMPGDPEAVGESAWYEYSNWEAEVPLQPGVDWAVSYVHHLIQQEHKIVGDYGRIILAGYSQGANLALESAITFPQPLGLVVSERGVLLPSRRKGLPNLAATPYILSAGDRDHSYTEAIVKQGAHLLKSKNAPVFMKTMAGLDHYTWSKPEWQLAIKAFAVALSTKQFSKVTDWTVSS